MDEPALPQWVKIFRYIEERPDQTYFSYSELSPLVGYDLKKSRGALSRVRAALQDVAGRPIVGNDAQGFFVSPQSEVSAS